LSGFIIYYTATNMTFTIGGFLKKRFLRVYPIYLVVTLGLIFLNLIAPSAGQSYKNDSQVILGSLTLYPQPVYILAVAWTLTYECLFYIVFGIAYFFGKKPLYATFITWSLIIILTCLLHIKFSSYALNSLINPIILNFGFGCLIAYLYQKYPNIRYWRAITLAGTALFMATWFISYRFTLVDSHPTAYGLLRLSLFGFPSAIIIFGLLYFKGKCSKLLVGLGDASYSLYLIHGNILAFLLKISLKIHMHSSAGKFVLATLIFILTIAIGRFFYILIERPLLKYLNKVFSGKKKTKNDDLAVKPVI